jgi:hypothetical protein
MSTKLNVNVVLLALLGLVPQILMSQNEYWGPDTTMEYPEMEYREALMHVYGDLLPYMSTDILLSVQPEEMMEVEKYALLEQDEIHTSYDYFLAYTAMEQSRLTEDTSQSFFDLNREAHRSFQRDRVIPLGLLAYHYNTIDSLGILNGSLCWGASKLNVCNPSSTTLFHQDTLVMLAPLFRYHDDDEITFKIDEKFFFTNSDESDPVQRIEISFGDDIFYAFEIGEEFDAWFEDIERPEIRARIHLQSGKVVESTSTIEISLAPGNEARGSHRKSSSCYQTYTIHSNAVNFDGADRVQTVAIPAPLYNTDAPNSGTVSGYYGVYYGCGNECGPIRKPFIIASGFAPFAPDGSKNINKPKADLYQAFNGTFGTDYADYGAQESSENNGSNILYKLRNEGYDVILVDFSIGIDYIQNAAALISEVIKKVNQEKMNGGHYFENVCQGNSMGGVAMRYALAKMEKDHYADPANHPHHHTRMFIANEAEMQGASIPLGIQFAVTNMTKKIPPNYTYTFLSSLGAPLVATVALAFQFDYLREQLIDNPAARSLLVHHHSVNQGNSGIILQSHPLHTQLFQELDTLGYPQDCRLVGISNGSSVGMVPATSSFGECLLDVKSTAKDQTSSRMRVHLEKPFVTSTLFEFNYGMKVGMTIPVRFTIQKIQKKYDKLWSYAPGSYEQFNRHILQAVADPSAFLPISIPLHISKCKNKVYRAPFVTTISALDIQNYQGVDFKYQAWSELFFDAPNQLEISKSFGYPHNNLSLSDPKSVTPFDAVYASPSNEYHVENPSIGQAIFTVLESNQRDNVIQNRIFRSGYKTEFEGYERILLSKNWSKRHQTKDVVFVKGSISSLNSEQAIRFLPGVHVAEGAELSASISPVPNSCYSFISLKRSKSRAPSENSEPNQEAIHSSPAEYSNSVFYPNPTEGLITIENENLDEPVKFKIISLEGKTVTMGTLINENKINLSQLSKGVFVLKLIIGNKEFHERIVIK